MRILILFILSIFNLETQGIESVSHCDSVTQLHLSQVALADSLYKNYLPQHNFEEVKTAVDFFELEIDEAGIERRTKDSDDRLLIYNCARAHYYHAVGLTERDDIIGACEHYLRALELMETNFTSQNLSDLDYDKTRFMALIYTRLGRLFLNENYCDLAIIKYNKALKYVKLMNDTHAEANILKGLANAYHLSGEADSALYYYNKSLRSDPDLHNRLDVEKSIAKILFDKGEKDSAYVLITNNLDKMEDYSARNSYYHLLGEMLYNDMRYDSAIVCFKLSMETMNKHALLSSSTYLGSIYDAIGSKEQKDFYDSISLSILNKEYNRGIDITRLQSLYKKYEDRKREKTVEIDKPSFVTYSIIILSVIFIIVLLLFIIHRRWKYKDVKKEVVHITEKNLLEYYSCDICKRIFADIERIEKGQLKISNLSSMSQEDLASLSMSANMKLNGIVNYIQTKFPELKNKDIHCICLLLLNINEPTVAVLLNKSYNAIWNRMRNVRSIMGIKSNMELFNI